MKILLIGDYDRAPFHPLTDIDNVVKSWLEPTHSVTAVEGYENLRYEVLKEYDIVIGYMDAFRSEISQEEAAGLVQYVAAGGRYLCWHGAVSIQKRVETAHVIGAYFTGHPPRLDLTFKTVEGNPIVEGVDPQFDLFEEPYQMDMRYGIECDVFLTFELDGRTCAGGWTCNYGLGSCIYFVPGHDLSVVTEKNVSKLFCNCVEYLSKQ